MDPRYKNSLRAAAIFAGLLSLPMTWITIHNPQFVNNGGVSDLRAMSLPIGAFDVTGFNGSVTAFIKFPLWLVIMTAIAANLIQFMPQSKSFAVPRAAEWLLAVMATLWMLVVGMAPIMTGGATLAAGWLVGLFCATAPLACLILSDAAEPKPKFRRPLPDKVFE